MYFTQANDEIKQHLTIKSVKNNQINLKELKSGTTTFTFSNKSTLIINKQDDQYEYTLKSVDGGLSRIVKTKLNGQSHMSNGGILIFINNDVLTISAGTIIEEE